MNRRRWGRRLQVALPAIRYRRTRSGEACIGAERGTQPAG
ncbi:hypothetical protein OH687_30405 [Burkholderia anthina]|nr:hypothetical protein OH687_30405 [Burkholderia anthina]